MSVMALTQPERKIVNRSELRQKQSATLRMARGNQVVVISATHEEDEKLLILDVSSSQPFNAYKLYASITQTTIPQIDHPTISFQKKSTRWIL